MHRLLNPHSLLHPPAGGQSSSALVEEMLTRAIQCHREGRWSDVERICRDLLSVDARLAEGLYLLGMVAYQSGRHGDAAKLLREAIAIREEEIAGCTADEGALGLKSQAADWFVELGMIFAQQQRAEEAAESYERAVSLNAESVAAWLNLGSIMRAQSKLPEAQSCYKRAVVLQPDCAEVHYNLGCVLQAQAKTDEAVASYGRALAIRPDYAEAHCNIGNALRELGRLPESVEHHRRAIAINPGLPGAYYNLGNTLRDDDKFQEAIACYEQELRLQPSSAEARFNLGYVHYLMGEVDEALTHYRMALALQSDNEQVRFNEGLAELRKGEFATGWPKYESRWEAGNKETPMRAYPQALWRGENLSSGKVLIWGEQGIGDEIMFAGLVPDVLHAGHRCVLDCTPRLKPLFARSFPEAEVVSTPGPRREPGFEFAAHLPSGSLGRIFRTSAAEFAATTSPYLLADDSWRRQFRKHYCDGRRLVGLAWLTKNRQSGRHRSIDLAALAPLFARRGVRWISLQYGEPEELERQIAAAGAAIFVDRSVDQLNDMDRFAAQVAAMDFVITIDNSAAHLAAALGLPTWLLLPFASDWRWLQARTDSPWYPTMRIFRQPKPGDWDSVVQGLVNAL
jgi:tetratricopeptide (TPR) repeat protein